MAEFELVAEGLRFPEGPVVMPDGSIILVEIADGQITRVHPDGSKSVIAKPGGGPNGLARSEEHTSELSHSTLSRMPSSA